MTRKDCCTPPQMLTMSDEYQVEGEWWWVSFCAECGSLLKTMNLAQYHENEPIGVRE